MTKKKGIEAREQLGAMEATFDDEALKAKVVLIRPGVNKSETREWKPEALKRASEAHFWDGTKMFLDHQQTKGHLPSKVLNRSIKDMVSAIESTEVGPDGEIIGTVEFFNQEFYDFSKRAQKHMGPSVNLLFTGDVTKRRGRRFEVVESLEHSKSVDWVTDPGAGGAILEFIATEGEDDVEWSEVTADMIRENRPDLVEAFEAATPPPDPTPPVADDKEEKDYLTKDDLAAAMKEAREEWDREQTVRETAREKYTAKIATSKLPAKTQARLMSAFEGTYDEKAVDKVIQEAREELKDAGLGPKVHNLGMSGSEDVSGGTDTASVAPLHNQMSQWFGSKKENQEGAN
jgi:hypothetical protein